LSPPFTCPDLAGDTGADHLQRALPLEMRLTRRNRDGALTPARVTDQGEVKADHTLYYRCRLAIADAAFEDVGAGDDPKAAYSDAIKRAAVRAGIGESLYAMDSPWLRVGEADNQLRVSRAGKPYIDERNTRWLRRMYEAWLTRAGAIFGEPLRTRPRRPSPARPKRPPTTRPPRRPSPRRRPAPATRPTPTSPLSARPRSRTSRARRPPRTAPSPPPTSPPDRPARTPSQARCPTTRA
jgi:hypothetical protein